MKLIIINGPNLNLLGIREKNIYGETSFDSYYETLIKKYNGKVDLEYYQSNHEGELIEKIQKIGFSYDIFKPKLSLISLLTFFIELLSIGSLSIKQ